jgi:hypothetical protein
MKELNEYRSQLLNRLVAVAHEFRTACLAAPDPFTSDAGGWNVHQLAAHTRDVDRLVYGARARKTVEADNPAFANFDGDAYAREHYSPTEPLNALLDEFVHSIEQLADLLRALPPEAWARESRHEKLGGGLTLQLWVERGLAHIEEHLETVNNVS